MDTTKQHNHDLGHGWFANFNADGPGTLTLRNGDKGQRINLSPQEVARLKAIMNGEASYPF